MWSYDPVCGHMSPACACDYIQGPSFKLESHSKSHDHTHGPPTLKEVCIILANEFKRIRYVQVLDEQQ